MGVNSWMSSITKDATNGGFTVDISNFDNTNNTVQATVDSAHHITIATTAGVNASGQYNNGTITLHYTTAAAGGIGGVTCDMTLIKQ